MEGLRRLSRGADVRAAPVRGDRVVAVAENRSRREDELRRLAALLAIVLPGTLALSAFIGYQVAGAALRPVDRIRREAQGITEGDLSARLREPGTRDELDRLTGTLNDLLGAARHGGRARAADRLRRRTRAAHADGRPAHAARRRRPRGAATRRRCRRRSTTPQVDVARLARLADDLLVLARADQGRLPLRPEPLDVQDVVEAAVARSDAAASELGRELSGGVRIPGGAVVLADPVRARPGARQRGRERAQPRRGARHAARAAGPEGGRRVAFVVADQGTGFGPELLPHAFERFVQDPDPPARRAARASASRSWPRSSRPRAAPSRATNLAGGGAEVTLLLPRA